MNLESTSSLHEIDVNLRLMLGGASTVVDCRVASQGPTVDLGDFVGLLVNTSGTTGSPKTVKLSREALLAAVEMVHDRLGGTGMWVSALSPFSVGGVMTMVRSVVAGTAHYQINSDLSDLRQPNGHAYLSLVAPQLHRALQDHHITETLSSYTAVLVGGGPIHPEVRLRAQEQGITVVSTYGMSETCGGVVYDGVPLAGVWVDLVDPLGGHQWDQGRIILNTPTAFSGYVEDHPVDEVILKGTTVLTFDIGRWCEGHLEVLGRVDDVIICGGSNVNLAEIQTHLDFLFPQQVACFAVADDVWGSTVVVASSGPTLDVIARGLEPFVASAAKPRGLLSMKELPRSESGKIDRIALIDEWRNRGAYSSVV